MKVGENLPHRGALGADLHKGARWACVGTNKIAFNMKKTIKVLGFITRSILANISINKANE